MEDINQEGSQIQRLHDSKTANFCRTSLFAFSNVLHLLLCLAIAKKEEEKKKIRMQ